MKDPCPSPPRIDSDLGEESDVDGSSDSVIDTEEEVFDNNSPFQTSISYGSLDHIDDGLRGEVQIRRQAQLNYEGKEECNESTPLLVDQDTIHPTAEFADNDHDSWENIFVAKQESKNNIQAARSVGDDTCATDSFTHIAFSIDSRCDMSDFIATIDEDKSVDSFQYMEQLQTKLLQKASDFELPVDPDKGYKATKLALWSFQRPHMRAFHGSWMCFCCAWLIWFSIVPLLPIISETSIPMTKEQIWTSNTFALLGTFSVPILAGPLCDQYGGKEILISLLIACAIPCGLGGFLIQSYESLLVVRFLTGFVGGTIVPVKFWVASHFAPETAGLAIATATGFGNVGAGLAQLIVGGLLMPFLQKYLNGNDDLAWRVALSIPSIFSLAVAFFFHYHADDCPLGGYREVRRAGLLTQKSAVDSFRTGALNLNAWLLFFQFGASLGIELVMESGLTMYLSETFELSVRRAAGLASLFGLMNLWARGTGGFLSDFAHRCFALRGRLCLQMILLLLEGAMIIGFIRAGNSLRTTLLWMLAFAATGQMAMGACFGVIPYIDKRCTGTISGIVGAGGHLIGAFLSNVFRTTPSDSESYHFMAYICIGAALLTPLINVAGHGGLFWKSRQETSTLYVPLDIRSSKT